jgi:hypothetical protein
MDAKLLNWAQTDAMVWAMLEDEPIFINDKGYKCIDCRKYFKRCVMARVAMHINSINRLSSHPGKDYITEILNTVAQNPGIHTERLKHSVEKNKSKHNLVSATLQLLKADGKLVSMRVEGKRGPKPEAWYLGEDPFSEDNQTTQL